MMCPIKSLNQILTARTNERIIPLAHCLGRGVYRAGFVSIVSALVLVGAGLGIPVQANSNFGTISLGESVDGYTAGAVPLFSILNVQAGENNQPCVGYADRNPDHILQLTTALSTVTVEINSNGEDTTLMIEAPDQTVYCSDDGNDSDAVITGQNWEAGDYKVWVGAFDSGQSYDYTLSVRQ